MDLKNGPSSYELYGAKKSGKKKNDFPSLEYEQLICNTKLSRFHLLPLFHIIRKHSDESTMNSIQSSMEVTNKPLKK